MNEAAFPNPHLRDGLGMTIRDVYAGLAMQGMFANPDDNHEQYDLSYEDYVKEIASCAYKMADAMLKAREA
jgi:hypothetical protein